jgi:glycosyltransferase involved in cell wall biosynthesis
MKIGVNLTGLVRGKAGGMEGYALNLIKALGELDGSNEYVLLLAPHNFQDVPRPSPRWSKIVYYGAETAPAAFQRLAHDGIPPEWGRQTTMRRVYRRLRTLPLPLWSGLLAPRLEALDLDLWFCPLLYNLPHELSVPTIVTIPDLQHTVFPQFFPEDELAFRTLGIEYGCRKASMVFAISEHVGSQLVETYELSRDKVVVTPLGVDKALSRPVSEQQLLEKRVRDKFDLTEPFIYYPALGWPHKNHETLIRALAIAHERGVPLQLVLTGTPYDLMTRIQPLLDDLGLVSAVRHLGHVAISDQVGLYAACEMVVVPSYYEGFGLPVLEAMSLGKPVACSRVGSLPEVAEDAALFFNPGDPGEVAEAICRLFSQPELRSQLIARGKRRATRFTYRQTAEHTLAAFEQAHESRTPSAKMAAYRPLDGAGFLRDGRSRFYISASGEARLRFQLIQPFSSPDLEPVPVRIVLNEQVEQEISLAPQRMHRGVIYLADSPGARPHKLEISASPVLDERGRSLAVRLVKLILESDQQAGLHLIEPGLDEDEGRDDLPRFNG